uniref:Uncharacterized protein n=1 Tax=Romanomermis culicivorax TaxID=13658 RepID=A0A915KBT4_ROMCU
MVQKRHFSPKCFKCQQAIKPMDYVTRVRNQRIYHVNCFHCVVCLRLLLPGEEFVLRGDNILCKSDSEELDKTEALSHVGFVDFADDSIIGPQSLFGAAVGRGQLTPLRNNNSETPPLNSLSQSPCNNSNNNRSNSPPIVIAEHPSISVVNIDWFSSSKFLNNKIKHCLKKNHSSNSSPGSDQTATNKKKDKPKTTRVRTVLNEKQLHTLRSIYGANPRPDALMKEQLVEMTGLSPRVIRVWFQNKRCKDKKRQIALKQMQQQQEKNQALNSIRLHGVGPLIAGAPGRLDMPPMMQALDVHQFQQNSAIWKQGGPPPPPGLHGLITDFGSPTGMLRGGPPPPEAMMVGLDGQTPFQQLGRQFIVNTKCDLLAEI